jgi:hypothetical protein
MPAHRITTKPRAVLSSVGLAAAVRVSRFWEQGWFKLYKMLPPRNQDRNMPRRDKIEAKHDLAYARNIKACDAWKAANTDYPDKVSG